MLSVFEYNSNDRKLENIPMSQLVLLVISTKPNSLKDEKLIIDFNFVNGKRREQQYKIYTGRYNMIAPCSINKYLYVRNGSNQQERKHVCYTFPYVPNGFPS